MHHLDLSATLAGARLAFVDRGHPLRPATEAFISAKYADFYGATLNRFMPRLVTLVGSGDWPLASMGLRGAVEEPLFLEHYLDRPVEECLAAAMGRPVRRDGVVELGNLVSVGAAAGAGATRWLILALNAYLQGAGMEWVVFTAVPAVRNAFTRLGLELTVLAAADGDRLGSAKATWGSYYDHGPLVVAGNVAQGFAALEQALQAERALAMTRDLWRHALTAGRAQLTAPRRWAELNGYPG